jgi:hypothetical protein
VCVCLCVFCIWTWLTILTVQMQFRRSSYTVSIRRYRCFHNHWRSAQHHLYSRRQLCVCVCVCV